MHNRGCHNFPSKNFCLTVPKNFRRGGSFSVSLISGTEKIWIRGGGGEGEYQDFPSKFLSHCTETFHWKTLWCRFRKILSSKFFMHRKCGSITVLSELFVSQHRNEKLRKGTLLFSGNFLVSKKNYG